MLGDKTNIGYIKSLLNFNNLFETIITHKKHIKNYIRSITKYYIVLITSMIDHDDRI